MITLTELATTDSETLNVDFEEFPDSRGRTAELELRPSRIPAAFKPAFYKWLDTKYAWSHVDWMEQFVVLYCNERPEESQRPLWISGIAVVWKNAQDPSPIEFGLGDKGRHNTVFLSPEFGYESLERSLKLWILPSSTDMRKLWQWRWPDAVGITYLYGTDLLVEMGNLTPEEYEEKLDNQPYNFSWSQWFLLFIRGNFQDITKSFVLADDIDMAGRRRSLKVGVRVASEATSCGLHIAKARGVFFTGEDVIKPVSHPSSLTRRRVDIDFVEFTIAARDGQPPEVPEQFAETFTQWLKLEYNVVRYNLDRGAPFLALFCSELPEVAERPLRIDGVAVIWRSDQESMPVEIVMGNQGGTRETVKTPKNEVFGVPTLPDFKRNSLTRVLPTLLASS